MKKFEYIIKYDVDETQLNKLGKKGWELVNFALTTDNDDDHESTAVFKRELKEK